MAAQKTGKRQRLKVRLIALTSILFIAALAAILCPGEPFLMNRATKVADTSDWDFRWTSYDWISNREVLFFRGGSPNHPIVNGWSFFKRDIAANQETYLDALSGFAYGSFGKHSQHAISPDGKRIFWTGDEPSIYCCNLDGTQQFHFKRGLFSRIAWMADSSRLVEYVMNEDADRIAHGLIHIPGNPKSQRMLKVPAVFTTANRNVSVSTNGQALTTTSDWEGQKAVDSVDVCEYVVGKETEPPHIHRIHLPVKATILGERFSPRGDRIVWPLLQETDIQTPILKWLHRYIPAFNLDPGAKMSIWVSRIDGSEMHEIGIVLLKPDRTNGGVVLADAPEYIFWQPDGKRLSFYLKDTLYTVPAD